ncbi:MAG: hypothetical protein RR335_08735 [Eubacterium sp.]
MPKKKIILLPCNGDGGGCIRVYKTAYEKLKKSRKIVITKEVINQEGVRLGYYSKLNSDAYGECYFKNLDLIEER